MAWTEIPVTKAGCRLLCSVFLWKKDKWWRILMHISLLVKSVTEIVFTSGEGPGSQGGRDTYCSLYVFSYCWPWVCITFSNMIRTLKSVSWSLTYISTGEYLYSLKIVLVFKNLILCEHWPPPFQKCINLILKRMLYVQNRSLKLCCHLSDIWRISNTLFLLFLCAA